MRASQAEALGSLCERLRGGGVEFQVGGSVLLRALGARVEPGDIDIVLPAGARQGLQAVAGDWWRGPVARSKGVVDSAWIADLVVGDEPVEAMGGLGLWIGGELRSVPYRPGPTWDLDGTEVPLAPPAQWLVLYSLYDPSRAKLLEPLVEPDELATTLAELGVAEVADLHYGNSA